MRTQHVHEAPLQSVSQSGLLSLRTHIVEIVSESTHKEGVV